MRTITVAAAMIVVLTAHANSQNLNMLGGLGDKHRLTAEEVAKQKAADEAYKSAVGKNPTIRGELCVTPPHQRTVRDRFTVKAECGSRRKRSTPTPPRETRAPPPFGGQVCRQTSILQ
jgi:hypothetical protein